MHHFNFEPFKKSIRITFVVKFLQSFNVFYELENIPLMIQGYSFLYFETSHYRKLSVKHCQWGKNLQWIQFTFDTKHVIALTFHIECVCVNISYIIAFFHYESNQTNANLSLFYWRSWCSCYFSKRSDFKNKSRKWLHCIFSSIRQLWFCECKMGRSKRVQSPHRKNSVNKIYNTKSGGRRRSILTLISPDDVTEGTLQVWRSLPQKIRQDPSLAPFQLENERVHG